MIVLKFGGTSLATAQRMQKLWPIISDQKKAQKKFIILSAISGATDLLEEITKELKAENINKALCILEGLGKKHEVFAKELLTRHRAREKALDVVKDQVLCVEKEIYKSASKRKTGLILAQGELLSTAFFHIFLEEMGVPSVLLPALSFMQTNEDQEPLEDVIRTQLEERLQQFTNQHIYITQGYICRNELGYPDNLKRGGSDFTASLIGAALNAGEIQIWTDIDGFHNNDPRYVHRTSPVKQLSFDEAAELAYFGAKILHPKSVHPAKTKNIPVYLLNTLAPKLPGTQISSHAEKQNKVVAISAKDNITAIRIQSSRMLNAYGFLRQVFDVFERYKTPIDIITTSEVAVSLTIDNTQNLDKITAELGSCGKVETDHHQSIVCVVGNFTGAMHGHASVVLEALKHIPIRMISYGGSEHNISLLIPESYKTEALRSLHYRFF